MCNGRLVLGLSISTKHTQHDQLKLNNLTHPAILELKKFRTKTLMSEFRRSVLGLRLS